MSIKQAIEALDDCITSMEMNPDNDHRVIERARAALAALRSMPAEPVGFMSEKQLALIKDPEGEHGHYIPMRKTPAGNFTFALYATPQPVTFQARVLPWMLDCFGERIAGDTAERNHRFLEEALELVQACSCTADEAHKLVDYVFGRDIGERSQEVGGVMVTLAALCLAQKLDMHEAAEVELSRITQPEMVERIREKQKRKPAMSPLPGVYPERLTQSEQLAQDQLAWGVSITRGGKRIDPAEVFKPAIVPFEFKKPDDSEGGLP